MMPNNEKGLPNTIKYSIWETNTNDFQPTNKEKTPKSIEIDNLESKTIDNLD